jgi:RNA polymerase subunit RPABC4/transcription elongation factor Spt4
MRYCHNCHKTTTGEPLFCQSCGRTYDAKLCPARHINPRWAEVCSECGSRDLSTPAPRVPWWLAPLLLAASLLPGLVLLLLLIMVLVGIVHELQTNQQIQAQLIAVLVVLALLWWLYLQLPHFIQNMFRSIWRKPKKDKHQH